VAYLVFFPPVLVLGPLAALLAASRPASAREWIWLAVAATWIGLLAVQPNGIAGGMLLAWGLMASGAFVVLMLTGERRVVAGALGSGLIATALATAWAWLLGTQWHDVMLAVAHEGWELCRSLTQSGTLSPERAAGVQVYVDAMAEGVSLTATLFPGLLIAIALPGMALAWSWYHRIAERPFGRPLRPFAEFRFGDDLVWAVVVCLTLLVLPLPDSARILGGNMAVVLGALYGARGAAVAWSAIRSLPGGVLVALGLGSVFILPVALSGLCLFGLTDTWVDFRRRFAPAA
jgi:hypothetical protein